MWLGSFRWNLVLPSYSTSISFSTLFVHCKWVAHEVVEEENKGAVAPDELIEALDLQSEPGDLTVQQQVGGQGSVWESARLVLSFPANSRRWQSLLHLP
jgi:hypothetical protein